MKPPIVFRRSWLDATVVAVSAVLAGAGLPIGLAAAQEKPPGFVALADVDPTIVQDMRYATAVNFTGAKVPGYETGACSLTRATAAALARVQKDLLVAGLSLKVYDCFRPQVATDAFVAWAAVGNPAGSGTGDATPNRYYPRVPRSRLIAAGYISAQSNHTKGTTVDLTLVRKPLPDGSSIEPSVPAQQDCGAPPDGSVDMGTGYDCLDPRSHQGAPGITGEQNRWRRKLASIMQRHGFRGYFREWWHFTYERDR